MNHSQLQVGYGTQTADGITLATVQGVESCWKYRTLDWINAQSGVQTTTIATSNTDSGVGGSTIRTLLVNAFDCYNDVKYLIG
jgi:hypothetical protein